MIRSIKKFFPRNRYLANTKPAAEQVKMMKIVETPEIKRLLRKNRMNGAVLVRPA
jgi:hypothetical protein